MGSGLRVFSGTMLALTAGIVLLSIYVNQGGFWMPTEVPVLEEEWWGPGKAPAKSDESIRPFKVAVPDKVLDDLKRRLENTRYASVPLDGVGFRYGFTSEALKKVVEFWKTKYNWRQRETFLNKYSQFMTNIQGLDIHFLHVKPKKTPPGVKVLPLLVLHGWPGSVRELYDVIDELTTPVEGKDVVFEVIAPSLPGYGWSQGAVRPGLGAGQIGIIFKGLMRRLGHDKFYVQGGDWGALIGSVMGTLMPDKVLGLHLNMCAVSTPITFIKQWLAAWWPALVYRADEMYMKGPKEFFAFIMEESGYMHLQATKPDTAAAGLSDSPAGLAAYILEKFSTWTNPDQRELPDGGLLKSEPHYPLENLLDNVMIYWVTGSVATSMRLYSENFSRAQQALALDFIPVKVPTACARFRHELLHQPDALLRDHFFNLVRSKDFSDGGHFAAMQLPKVLAKDVREAIADMEKLRQK